MSVLRDAERPESVRLVVRDSGIGMTDATMARLFQPFTQADSSTTREYGGTGLGLTICQRIVTLMGGRIEVESAPGEGSTFTVALPLRATRSAAATPSRPLAGVRVAFVHAHPFVRQAGEHYLCAAGAEVAVADAISSGLVATLVSWSEEGSGAVVLVGADAVTTSSMLGDPGALGLAERWPASVRRVVAAAPVADERDAATAADAGIVTVAVEPLRRGALRRAVERAIGRGDEPAAASTPAPAPEASAARLLVAEDNRINRVVIGRQLASLGYQCEFAEDGEAALRAWRDGDFDLLLTDCHMPGLDGYQLASAIREDERAAGRDRMPIIAVTANALDGEAQRCVDAGMDDYLAKPLEVAALDRCLRRWLETAEMAT